LFADVMIASRGRSSRKGEFRFRDRRRSRAGHPDARTRAALARSGRLVACASRSWEPPWPPPQRPSPEAFASRQGVGDRVARLRSSQAAYNPPNVVFAPIAWTTPVRRHHRDLGRHHRYVPRRRPKADRPMPTLPLWAPTSRSICRLEPGVFFKMHKLGPSCDRGGQRCAASSADLLAGRRRRPEVRGRPAPYPLCAHSRRCCPPASGGATAKTKRHRCKRGRVTSADQANRRTGSN